MLNGFHPQLEGGCDCKFRKQIHQLDVGVSEGQPRTIYLNVQRHATTYFTGANFIKVSLLNAV